MFIPFDIQNGLLADLSHDAFPTQVFGWNDGALELAADATHYGIVLESNIVLTKLPAGSASLAPFVVYSEMYFVHPGVGLMLGFEGSIGLVISRLGYRGLRQIGGPIEEKGRLTYIDGCSDTLLVCPPRLGEPCLNHLHIPPHTRQSPHTHPSERIGVILRGRGECRTPEGVHPLTPGMGWRIPAGSLHSFFTQEQSLDVIAWHPDSDFGPTDDNHPMINRTVLSPRPSPSEAGG